MMLLWTAFGWCRLGIGVIIISYSRCCLLSLRVALAAGFASVEPASNRNSLSNIMNQINVLVTSMSYCDKEVVQLRLRCT